MGVPETDPTPPSSASMPSFTRSLPVSPLVDAKGRSMENSDTSETSYSLPVSCAKKMKLALGRKNKTSI